MKSGETQSSQAEIIRSVVKQNPKQHAGCDSPKPEVIWTVVKLTTKTVVKDGDVGGADQ